MPNLPHTGRDEPDRAFAFRLRAGPKDFAEQLHATVRRTVERAIEESLDTRDTARGWAEVGSLRSDGKRSS